MKKMGDQDEEVTDVRHATVGVTTRAMTICTQSGDPKIRDHHGRIVISDAAGAWPRPPQNDCASQEGATPKPGAGARSHVALLRTLAFRVGRRVRISFAPAGVRCELDTGFRDQRSARWRSSRREKRRGKTGPHAMVRLLARRDARRRGPVHRERGKPLGGTGSLWVKILRRRAQIK
jgi:hypothetical protein